MAFGPGGEIVPAGRCGSGFTRAQRDTIRDRLDAKEYVPIEVTFNGISKKGLLRHPRFKGFRNDIDPEDTEALGVAQFLTVNVTT